MNQGRDLDAAIAEKVMGWKPGIATVQVGSDVIGGMHFPRTQEQTILYPPNFDPKNYRPPDGAGLAEATKWIPPDDSEFQVPAYSTDITAAWDVVEKLKKKHRVLVYALEKGGYWVEVDSFDDRRMGVGHYDQVAQSESETAPHAICLAALRSCGS